MVTAKGGNTTNLFHHLKQKHTREYEQSQKKWREEESSAAGDVRTKAGKWR